MSCERFHAALAAHAAGGELDPAAARHLAGCGACQDRLDAQRRMLGELDAELERALAISASPDFAARVAHATSGVRAEAGRWRVSTPLLAGLGMAAAIVLAVWVRQPAVVDSGPAAAFRPKAETTRAEGTRAEATRFPQASAAAHTDCVASAFRRKAAPGDCEASSVTRPSTVLGAAASPKSRKSPARDARRVNADPPVIVEPSRALALERLRELNAQGRLDGNALPRAVTPEAALAELTITPLEIADIRVPDVEIVNRPSAAPQRQ